MRKLFRNGAGILFAFSCAVFVGLFIYQLRMLGDLQQASAAGAYEGQLPAPWLAVLGALSGALSAAVIPFFGACLVDRIDAILSRREAAE
jgi:hypothetical protein